MIKLKEKIFKWNFDNDVNGLYVYITFTTMIYFLIYAGLFFITGFISGIILMVLL